MKRMTVGELKEIINYLKDEVIVEITDDVLANVDINKNGDWYSAELELKTEDNAGVLNFEETTIMPCSGVCLPSKETLKEELTQEKHVYIYRVKDVISRHPSIDCDKRKLIIEHVNQLTEIYIDCLCDIEKGNYDKINCLKTKHDEIYSEIDKFAIPGGAKEYRRMKSRINVLNDIMNNILSIFKNYGRVCEIEREQCKKAGID